MLVLDSGRAGIYLLVHETAAHNRGRPARAVGSRAGRDSSAAPSPCWSEPHREGHRHFPHGQCPWVLTFLSTGIDRRTVMPILVGTLLLQSKRPGNASLLPTRLDRSKTYEGWT